MRPIAEGRCEGPKCPSGTRKLPSGGLREIRTSRQRSSDCGPGEQSLPTTCAASLRQVAARKCATPHYCGCPPGTRAQRGRHLQDRRIAAEACHTWCRRAAAAANASCEDGYQWIAGYPQHMRANVAVRPVSRTSRRDAARRARAWNRETSSCQPRFNGSCTSAGSALDGVFRSQDPNCCQAPSRMINGTCCSPELLASGLCGSATNICQRPKVMSDGRCVCPSGTVGDDCHRIVRQYDMRPRRTACRWKMRAPEEKAADFGRVADADAAEHSIGHRHRDPAAAAAIRLAACRRAAGHAGGAADEAPSQTGDDEVTDMTIVTSNHSAPAIAAVYWHRRCADVGDACLQCQLSCPASWCALYKTGGTNCGFTSHAQCQASVSGVGGFCNEVPDGKSGAKVAARGATAEGRKANKRTGAESSGKAAPG